MKKQKIYILPTRFGIVFLGAIIVVLLAGAAYSNNLVNLLAFFMLSIAFVCMVQTHNNLKYISVPLCHVDSGFASQHVTLQTVLENASNTPRFNLDAAPKQIKVLHNIESVLPLMAHGTLKLKGTYQISERGPYRLKRVKISTIYPLGLFYAWSWYKIDAKFYVYPKVEGKLPLPQPKYELNDSSKAQARGGDDFSGHRKYNQGDSSRHIDWKAYARGRPLLTKEFNDGAPQALLFDWQAVPLVNEEQKLSQITSWIEQAKQRQVPYALQMPKVFIPPSFGPKHDQRCLELLAAYGEKLEQAIG